MSEHCFSPQISQMGADEDFEQEETEVTESDVKNLSSLFSLFPPVQ
jgi:hypothetical protein